MEEFFKWLTNTPIASNVLIIAFSVLLFAAILIFSFAFYQGRDISFWPPKIGQKPVKPPKMLESHNATSNDFGKTFMFQQTGIVDIFANLDECRDILCTDFKKANDIRLLIQIGKKEFGNQEPSFFWSLAKDTKNQPETIIKVLRASPVSPFLSELRAKFRNTPLEQWQGDVQRLSDALRLLKNAYGVKIQIRVHSEPYLWRIFIFDDVAYVSAYLYPRDNDSQAVVYRIQKGNNSLYFVFSKYFDYLWVKYDPSGSKDEIKKWSTWV